MQHGHDDLEGRAVLLLMHVNRDTAAVVDNLDVVVFGDGNFYVSSITGHALVYTVIHDLRDEVVKTFDTDVANIHGGAFANSFQAFEDLDTIGRVIAVLF
jgi:hypothetical protein